MTINYTEKWGIDSNLLLYFLDADSIFHLQTVSLFRDLLNNKASLYSTQNNIIEAHRVLVSFYQMPKEVALENILKVVDSLNIQLVTSSSLTMGIYTNFCRIAQKNDLFDLYFASILVDNQIKHLLTNNPKDFIGLEEEIVVQLPF